MSAEGPNPADPAGSAGHTSSPAEGQAGTLARVFEETPDVILMLQLGDEGSLVCQTAISSFPTAPSLSTLTGRSIEDVLPRDLLQRFGPRYAEARERSGPVRYEERIQGARGELVLDAAITPIVDDQGSVTHLFWSARNVTDQWAAAETARRAEARSSGLEQRYRELEQRAQQLETLEARAQELEREHRELEARLAEAEERATESAGLGERATELEAEREALASEKEALEAERQALEERAAALEATTEGLKEERGLLEEQARFLFDEAAIGLAWTDADAKILEANRTFASVLSTSTEQLVGAGMTDLVHDDDLGGLTGGISDLLSGEREGVQTELRMRHDEGELAYVQLAIARVGEGDEERLLWQVTDLTERRGLQERLAHQALHDALTGLPNRALFLDRLARGLTRLDRSPSTVAVMVMDLDRFEDVNELHGHEVGDRVLSHVAEALKDALRASDTVGRLESDEFGLLCEDLENPGDAEALADRLRKAVEGKVKVDDAEIDVRVSIGVALTADTADRPETLLRDATIAMREAKAGGRARTEIFDEAKREETAQRFQTETDLERAIKEGEFRVFYQPQIDLESGTIVGVEVLARWQQPERGIVTPGEFIALAEETGLIIPLGTWVLEQACLQSKKWPETASGDPILTWVNVSPRQLADPDLPDIVSKVLAETGANPAALCVEVTEGILMDETGTAISVLRELKEMGLHIGIDDFGKGFSSLTYLKRLPVDMLKIDRGFVQGLGQNKEDSAIAAAVVNLARAMDLTSIAEGVETPQQLAALRELGCDLAQGYLFSSPQPPEVVGELLSQGLRW